MPPLFKLDFLLRADERADPAAVAALQAGHRLQLREVSPAAAAAAAPEQQQPAQQPHAQPASAPDQAGGENVEPPCSPVAEGGLGRGAEGGDSAMQDAPGSMQDAPSSMQDAPCATEPAEQPGTMPEANTMPEASTKPEAGTNLEASTKLGGSARASKGPELCVCSASGQVLGLVPPDVAGRLPQDADLGAVQLRVRSVRKVPQTGVQEVMLRLEILPAGSKAAGSTGEGQQEHTRELADIDPSGFQLSRVQLEQLAASQPVRMALMDERLQHILKDIDTAARPEQVLEAVLLRDPAFEAFASQMLQAVQPGQ